MDSLKLHLTKKTELHSKYDPGCTLCPPDRAVVRKLACGEFKVTQATLTGINMEREATVCDDCIEEMRADDEVEVIDHD